VCEEDERLYLVREYVEGQTLERWCRRSERLPPATAVALVAAAARGLDAVHRAGIVHGDIRPANLIRVGPGAVKITGFVGATPKTAALTRDGVDPWTACCMAPEQVRGAAVDGRADLFALAVVLFELLAGRRPFPGDDVPSVLYRIVASCTSRRRISPRSLRTFPPRSCA
jgi:serine/threonine-protein kinase